MATLKQEIATLLADNDTGAIEPGDVRYLFTRVVERGPNQAPSLWKSVRYMTRAEANADPYPGGDVFEEIDFASCCIYTTVWVDFYRPTPSSPLEYGGTMLRAYYDGEPGAKYKVQRTAGFLDYELVPAKFIKVGSVAEQLAQQTNIPVLDPAKKDYAQGVTVKQLINGQYYLFSSVKAGGPYPAPTTPAGTTNWTSVAPPTSLASLATPNTRLSAAKSVLYLTEAEAVAAGRSGVATLDKIDPLSCCTGTVAYIDLPPAGTSNWRVLTYDNRPLGSAGQVNGFFDGSGTRYYNLNPTTGLAALKWVEKDSAAAVAANIPFYSATVSYPVGYTVRYSLNGTESFFYAKQAGQLPAPAGGGDANWKVVPGPVGATALSQMMTLAEAQAINHDQAVAGRLYLIDFGPDQAGYTQTVSLLGVSDNAFSIRGICEANGVQTAVRVNVDSGVFGEEASYNTIVVTDVGISKKAAVVNAVGDSLYRGGKAVAYDTAAMAPGDQLASTDYVGREFFDQAAGFFYKCHLDSTGQVIWFRLLNQ